MSLIEQAAKRLEQLRKAGVEMPTPTTELVPPPLGSAADQPSLETKRESTSISPALSDANGTKPDTPISRHIDLDLNTLATTGLIAGRTSLTTGRSISGHQTPPDCQRHGQGGDAESNAATSSW